MRSEESTMLADEPYDGNEAALVARRQRTRGLCQRLNGLSVGADTADERAHRLNLLFGPGVHIYTATHPLSAAQRRTGLESGAPVSTGDDVWVGADAIICPGVNTGSGAVIGASSVVIRDVPPGVFAAGNPCRVLRSIADDDAT